MSGIVGQNTLDNSGLIKSPAAGGAWNFISKQTASADSTINFTSGIDSTYRKYLFTFKNIHPSDDGADFSVGFRDGSTAYDATKTTTVFRAYHYENDSGAGLGYLTGHDLAQSTDFQNVADVSGNDNDNNLSGELKLFAPSDTTFVKHFMSRMNGTHGPDFSIDYFAAGYCNVTAAIDGVQFKFVSDEIQDGTISLYGIT